MLSGAPAATFILAAMVVASLLALQVQPAWLERGVFRPHWLVRRQAWHTVVTSAFLHADLPHLLFNGFTFWAFAFNLERTLGTASFVALYGLGIALSNALTWLRHRAEPGYSSVGASGAISAVLLASVLYFPQARLVVFPLPVPLPAPLFAVGYLAYESWAARRGTDRVNHDAHFGGAVAGVLYVAFTEPAALGRFLRWFTG